MSSDHSGLDSTSILPTMSGNMSKEADPEDAQNSTRYASQFPCVGKRPRKKKRDTPQSQIFPIPMGLPQRMRTLNGVIPGKMPQKVGAWNAPSMQAAGRQRRLHRRMAHSQENEYATGTYWSMPIQRNSAGCVQYEDACVRMSQSPGNVTITWRGTSHDPSAWGRPLSRIWKYVTSAHAGLCTSLSGSGRDVVLSGWSISPHTRLLQGPENASTGPARD